MSVRCVRRAAGRPLRVQGSPARYGRGAHETSECECTERVAVLCFGQARWTVFVLAFHFLIFLSMGGRANHTK